MNSSVDTAIMAYRQHIKEMIHGKRTVGFRKFLNQVALPTRTKSGSLMQFCELNAVEMSGTRRQLNHWKQTRHRTDFAIVQQKRLFLNKNHNKSFEQSNFANDNSIREFSNNTYPEEVSPIRLSKFEQQKIKLKEDLLRPLGDKDSIYEAQKACDYLQGIAHILRPRLEGTENGFQVLESSPESEQSSQEVAFDLKAQ